MLKKEGFVVNILKSVRHIRLLQQQLEKHTMAGNDNQKKYGLVEICQFNQQRTFFGLIREISFLFVKWKTGHQQMVLLAGHI